MAQLSDILAYVHDQLALFANAALEDRQAAPPQMLIDWDQWQRLLKMEMQLAGYLRQIADPQR